MKKFKLKKEYPGVLIKPGDVVIQKANGWYFPENGGNGVWGNLVENYPEFWEEIVTLCVSCGTKFIVFLDEADNTVYTIVNVNESSSEVRVEWENSVSTFYTIESVNDYFRSGVWVEYKEFVKNYEILSFKTTLDGGSSWNLTTLRDNGYYIVEGKEPHDTPSGQGATEFYMLNKFCTKTGDEVLINSVKRLSDGEIFQIGDMIEGTQSVRDGKLKIKKFNITPKGHLNVVHCTGTSTYVFSDTRVKVVKPVLTTEDGVDIYEGDGYYLVYFNEGRWDSAKNDLYKISELCTAKPLMCGESWSKDCKFFSTEKAAKNYIICNKPVLSFNDVWNMSGHKDSDNSYVNISKNELKELAKSKL